jgi:hypothetical protein
MEAAQDVLLVTLIAELILKLRRNINPDSSWGEFRALVETNIDRVCRELNTRELVSVCDTYADFADPVESRNAMLVSLLANAEKTSQSFLMLRLNYIAPFRVPLSHHPRRVPLWDGMDSFHLEIGDVTNGLFGRLDRLMSSTPAIERIYREVVDRIRTHPTILGALNKFHQHVFEPNTRWRKAPAYDHFRKSGELPPWKTDD